MAARTAGRLGRGGGPAPARLSPPLRRCEAAVLEEGVGEHRHERMAVQAGPGPALEVVEAEFVLQLLVGLDRKSTRLNSSHANISYAVFCLKKKKKLLRLSRTSSSRTLV